MASCKEHKAIEKCHSKHCSQQNQEGPLAALDCRDEATPSSNEPQTSNGASGSSGSRSGVHANNSAMLQCPSCNEHMKIGLKSTPSKLAGNNQRPNSKSKSNERRFNSQDKQVFKVPQPVAQRAKLTKRRPFKPNLGLGLISQDDEMPSVHDHNIEMVEERHIPARKVFEEQADQEQLITCIRDDSFDPCKDISSQLQALDDESKNPLYFSGKAGGMSLRESTSLDAAIVPDKSPQRRINSSQKTVTFGSQDLVCKESLKDKGRGSQQRPVQRAKKYWEVDSQTSESIKVDKKPSKESKQRVTAPNKKGEAAAKNRTRVFESKLVQKVKRGKESKDRAERSEEDGIDCLGLMDKNGRLTRGTKQTQNVSWKAPKPVNTRSQRQQDDKNSAKKVTGNYTFGLLRDDMIDEEVAPQVKPANQSAKRTTARETKVFRVYKDYCYKGVQLRRNLIDEKCDKENGHCNERNGKDTGRTAVSNIKRSVSRGGARQQKLSAWITSDADQQSQSQKAGSMSSATQSNKDKAEVSQQESLSSSYISSAMSFAKAGKMTADAMLGTFGDKIMRAAELQGVRSGAKCPCNDKNAGSSKKEPCMTCENQPEGTAANTTQLGNDTATKEADRVDEEEKPLEPHKIARTSMEVNGVRKRLGFVPSDDEDIESSDAVEEVAPEPATVNISKPSPLGLQIDSSSSMNDSASEDEKSVVCVDDIQDEQEEMQIDTEPVAPGDTETRVDEALAEAAKRGQEDVFDLEFIYQDQVASNPVDEKGQVMREQNELTRKRGRRKRQDQLIDCTNQSFQPESKTSTVREPEEVRAASYEPRRRQKKGRKNQHERDANGRYIRGSSQQEATDEDSKTKRGAMQLGFDDDCLEDLLDSQTMNQNELPEDKSNQSSQDPNEGMNDVSSNESERPGEEDAQADESSSDEAPAPKSRQKRGGKRRKTSPGYYEVERVVDHRINTAKKYKKELQLKIAWRGYEEKTWEQFVSFARDSPEMLQSYWLSYEKKTDKLRENIAMLQKNHAQVVAQMKNKTCTCRHSAMPMSLARKREVKMVDKAIQSGMRRIMIGESREDELTGEPTSGEQAQKLLDLMLKEETLENGSHGQEMKYEVPCGYVEEIEAESSVNSISHSSSDSEDSFSEQQRLDEQMLERLQRCEDHSTQPLFTAQQVERFLRIQRNNIFQKTPWKRIKMSIGPIIKADSQIKAGANLYSPENTDQELDDLKRKYPQLIQRMDDNDAIDVKDSKMDEDSNMLNNEAKMTMDDSEAKPVSLDAQEETTANPEQSSLSKAQAQIMQQGDSENKQTADSVDQNKFTMKDSQQKTYQCRMIKLTNQVTNEHKILPVSTDLLESRDLAALMSYLRSKQIKFAKRCEIQLEINGAENITQHEFSFLN